MTENRTISKNNKSNGISEAEEKRIREAIERTDTEKFFFFTRLMKIHFMLKNALIVKK
ncbi:MAG: hypothetical protein ACTHML_00360 [Ginsengibacter sp.]|jgi:hypothetical protein